MQEEQTGKKRQEKLEWMYATPATGSGANANELEDYLLGKKRVDKILIGGENEKVCYILLQLSSRTAYCHFQVGASHKNFIATQYANTARDTASKIREDPLLAIKQQEQAAYQALMSNPLRLREMQERTGIKPKKDKKDKKEKKKHKKDKHRDRSASPRSDRYRSASPDRYRSSRRSPSPRRRDSRSRSPLRGSRYDYDRHDRDSRRGYSRSPGSSRRRDRSMSPRGRRDNSRVRTWPRSDDSDDNTRRGRERSRSPELRSTNRHDDDRKRRYSPSPRREEEYKRSRRSPPPPRRPYGEDSRKPTATNAAEDRAARLAAMSTNASEMSVERREHLTKLLEKEKAELEVEEAARAKNKGMGSFLSQEQKKVFGGSGGLEERIRRGRGQMHVDAD